jgi:hypothetical protein
MQFFIDVAIVALYVSVFILFCAWSWRFWMMYINQKYLASMDWVMLEIKLPREIDKSPLAAEMALAGMLQSSSVSKVFHRNFEGKLPHYGSLEIASIEGVIHFYIRVQRKFKTLMETNMYSQYPEIEIVEADDYTKLIRYHHLSKDVSTWGITMRPGKKWKPTNPKTGKPYGSEKSPVEMPADFYPIKTYVDYGLDKDPKEEHKVDPLTQLLELMGSVGKGEYLWYQVLVQDESVYSGKKMQKFYVNPDTHEHVSLSDMAEGRKKQIRTAEYISHGQKVYDKYGYEEKPRLVDTGEKDKDGKPIMKSVELTYNIVDEKGKPKDPKAVSKKETELTQDEKDELEIINKKMSKPLAVAVVRIVYVAKKENFKPGYSGSTLSLLMPFAGWNKFAPVKLSNPYDYPWETFHGKRPAWRGEEIFEEYVEREGFYPHVESREALDKWEDRFFWSSTMKERKLFRMLYEAIFYPFSHPSAQDTAFIVNTEELATLWHLPGATAATPTLPRINSTKGIAPVNLPL